MKKMRPKPQYKGPREPPTFEYNEDTQELRIYVTYVPEELMVTLSDESTRGGILPKPPKKSGMPGVADSGGVPIKPPKKFVVQIV